jgi:lipid II:glycine glycyltransferase (peptidoglycan interpeptide bridge formation enzyme)
LNAFFHLKNTTKRVPGIRVDSHTLELDLTQDMEVIISNFSKQVRQQTKIAEKEGTSCYFHKDIDQFVVFFNDFAAKKDTWTTSKNRIEEMGDVIKLSFAVNNGQILAAHSYMVDNEMGIVRHLHSATKRLDETFDRNLIGRANKYLTVTDIVYFKKNGLKVFDFGGYAKDTDNESLKGINNYKLLFGGKLVTCINYYSINYWLIKRLVNLIGMSGKI